MDELTDEQKQINAAIEVITRYGGTDGAHHKQWVLDQALRALMGAETYQRWIEEQEREGYEWDEGIAP